MKTLLSIVIFITVAIIAWWSVSDKKPYNGILPHAINRPYLELFMDNFKMTAINSLGSPDYILTGKHLERYSNSDDATISQPTFKFLRENSQWLIIAKHAIINQKKKTIVLNDNVVMQQQNSSEPIQITSKSMHIDTEKLTAYTSMPVHIKQGLSKMQSTGMVFYSQKKILELNEKVKGYYLNTKPSSN